jgi:SWI/SNF-related matrix-associated actin-dependent regulator of chromatin subfamily A-like protein 1
VKYKKCCGRDEPRPRAGVLKPRYTQGAERDPAYWRALKAARNRFSMPTVAWEDPRTVAALLGLAQRPAVELRRPPEDADFDALIGALERAAQSGAADVRLRAGSPAAELVFAFPFDDELSAAIKRLPGRRFEGLERAWIVPAAPASAAAVEELLEDHPWLVITDEVEEWLDAHLHAWSGCMTVAELAGDGGPVLLVHSHADEPPPEIVERSIWSGNDVLLLPCDRDSAALLRGRPDIDADAPATAALTALAAGRRPPGATLTLGRDDQQEPRFELRTDWLFSAAQAFAELPEATAVGTRDQGCFYEEQETVRAVPADPAIADDLHELLHRFPDVLPDREAARCLERLEAERARAAETIALSLAHDAELNTDALNGELRPFQRAGVCYALRQRRTFLADEQGLGKTIEALAALELDGAFPAAVICPASMKLVWRAECERWLPRRSVAVLDGRSADRWEHADAPGAEVIICNYDIVEAHAGRLADRGLRAAVFDESHYCKDPRRKRTKAAIGLAEQVAQDGLRLALTGTLIMNRPRDLVAQLRLIGRLGDFGSGAGMGRRFRGPHALERLHWHLRAHCYVRRTKADVLPQLPPKRLATVPVELDNAREYRLAEDDVIAWLHTLPLDLRTLQARVAAALRAEQLARLNYLRRLAAMGKLRAALEWITDFVSSGEPLVVFAHHREVQRALLQRFPDAAHVLGGDDLAARAVAIEQFQRPDGEPLIVCSLQAGSQGITLTRASNVAFLELDWTPARHDQAEDRCHRIGQRDAVTAYYLLAPDTIDAHMAGVLHRKRGLIGAVTDGRDPATDTGLDQVVRALRGIGTAAKMQAA